MCGMASGVLSATSDQPHCSRAACRVAHKTKGVNAQLGYSKSRFGCDMKTKSRLPPLSLLKPQSCLENRRQYHMTARCPLHWHLELAFCATTRPVWE